MENSGDQKKLFAASNRLLTKDLPTVYLPLLKGLKFAEDIGKFFVQKIMHIRNRLDCHGAVNYHKPDIEG